MAGKHASQSKGSTSQGRASKGLMTPVRARALQRQAGNVKSGSFESRAISAADRNVNNGLVPRAPSRKP